MACPQARRCVLPKDSINTSVMLYLQLPQGFVLCCKKVAAQRVMLKASPSPPCQRQQAA